MKWFPWLFANVNLLFFTGTIFDNMAICGDSSPAIFNHYTENYSWMSRQFPDNHWCCGERHWSLSVSVFLSWWQHISLCSWNLKYSSILSARAHYSSPWFWRDSIPQSVGWTLHQQSIALTSWNADFCCVSSSHTLSFHYAILITLYNQKGSIHWLLSLLNTMRKIMVLQTSMWMCSFVC